MASHMQMLPDGKKIPSVTTVLKDTETVEPIGIRKWKENLVKMGINPEDEMDRLAKIGTVAHFRTLSGISPVKIEAPEFPVSQWPENTAQYAKTTEEIVLKWLEDKGYALRRPTCEFFFCNPVLGYCGSADVKCEIDDVVTIIDLKTSSAVREHHEIQVAAYARHFEADQGIVLCACPYPEKNPKMNWKESILNDIKLDTLYDKFDTRCQKWHEKYN